MTIPCTRHALSCEKGEIRFELEFEECLTRGGIRQSQNTSERTSRGFLLAVPNSTSSNPIHLGTRPRSLGGGCAFLLRGSDEVSKT